MVRFDGFIQSIEDKILLYILDGKIQYAVECSQVVDFVLTNKSCVFVFLVEPLTLFTRRVKTDFNFITELIQGHTFEILRLFRCGFLLAIVFHRNVGCIVLSFEVCCWVTPNIKAARKLACKCVYVAKTKGVVTINNDFNFLAHSNCSWWLYIQLV